MATDRRAEDRLPATLEARAVEEGRSTQGVARTAIAAGAPSQAQRLRTAIETVRTEDAELLERLGR